jgi:hypothetical protein
MQLRELSLVVHGVMAIVVQRVFVLDVPLWQLLQGRYNSMWSHIDKVIRCEWAGRDLAHGFQLDLDIFFIPLIDP